MNCDQIDTLLHEYIDGSLPDEQCSAVVEHHQTCEQCASKHQNMVALITNIQSLPVAPHAPDFAERVLRNATDNNSASAASLNKRHALPVFGSAIAAGFALWFFFASSFIMTPVETTPEIFVSNQVQTIKVAINSEDSIEGVDISVQLSSNLELNGFGTRKTIRWKTNLKQGINIISLPIVGIAMGEGELVTRIQLKSKEKSVRIKTLFKHLDNVRNFGNSNFVA